MQVNTVLKASTDVTGMAALATLPAKSAQYFEPSPFPIPDTTSQVRLGFRICISLVRACCRTIRVQNERQQRQIEEP